MRHVPHQIDAAARVAPFVVVPRQDLDEVAVHDLRVRRVEHRGVRVAAEVDRDERRGHVFDDAFEAPVGRGLERRVDSLRPSSFSSSSAVRSTTETFGVGTRSAMPSSLPLSAGSTSPTRRRRARRRRNDRQRRRARAAQILVRQVEQVLIVRVGVHGRHPALVLMPNVSCSTFAIGARQFVVHDAFEMM